MKKLLEDFKEARKLTLKQAKSLARIKRYREQLAYYRQQLAEEYDKLVNLGFSVDDIDWRDSMEDEDAPADGLLERLEELNDMLGIK